MTIPCKFERSILSHDEHEIILQSHHPGIYDVGLEELKVLRQRLRDMRNRERTLAREKRREVRGKGEPRGGSFPGVTGGVNPRIDGGGSSVAGGRNAIIVVLGVLIVGSVLSQMVRRRIGISPGWLGLFFGFALIRTIDQVAGKTPYRK